MAKTAPDFNKIIQDGRERKRNEALASRVFGRDRRQSAPSALKPRAAPSLASRIGPKKPQQQQQQQQQQPKRPARASLPAAGNVHGDWTHDLHDVINTGSSRTLASRVHKPGQQPRPLTAPQNGKKKQVKLAAALGRMDVDEDVARQVNVVKPAGRPAQGITIRGLAGPYAIMAQNFAPGTTLADIESAMTPVGGEIVTSRMVKTQPIIVVEVSFASREGGDQVISTFNDKMADGRLIKVYPKVGGQQSFSAPPAETAPNDRRPRGSDREQVIDGSLGFGIDLTRDTSISNKSGGVSNSRPLYSDKIVAGNRRGRGGQHGRGGR